MSPSHTDELVEELRSTFLFEPFSEEQLYWLAAHATIESLDLGAYAFTESEAPDALWVLLSGEWRLSRTVDGQKFDGGTSSSPGSWAGYLPALDWRVALGVQAVQPSRLLRIPAPAVEHMFVSGYPITRHLVGGIYQGVQELMNQTRDRDKLIALGKLSAGLAHELNNPASAARNAAAELRRVLTGTAGHLQLLRDSDTNDPTAAVTTQVAERLAKALDAGASSAEGLDPLERSDRQDQVADWLRGHAVSDADEGAAALVDVGLDVPSLEHLFDGFTPEMQNIVLPSLIRTASARSLVDQIERSTARVSELVSAIKSYSYMDQAPIQEVDVHEGLESTLTMLGHKLRGGITVTRDYDASLPKITASGSELNQVWTNLIDNAIDAMQGHGELRMSTRRDLEDVVVEIGDTGPGVPAEVQPRIFEPFFTTKDVGKGTGLGLDIAYRVVVAEHHGDITVRSVPGNTVFTVRIPISRPLS